MKKIPCLIYSRVCGYFQPLNQWNKGKQSEMRDRKDLLTKKYIMKRDNENG